MSTNRVRFPSEGYHRTDPFDTDGLSHVLEVWVVRHNIVIRQGVRLGAGNFATADATSAGFPEDEPY